MEGLCRFGRYGENVVGCRGLGNLCERVVSATAREVLLDDWIRDDRRSVRRFSDYWLRQMRLVILISCLWCRLRL